MTTLVCDYAHGRAKEFYMRVKNSDPAGCALVVILLANAGIESDDVLSTKPSVASLLAGTTNEATNTGYTRKIIQAADLAAIPSPDTVNHWWQALLTAVNQVVWGPAVQNDGTGTISRLLTAFRPAGASPDSDLVPYTLHDFLEGGNPVAPTGISLVAQFDANGYVRAQRA